MNVEKFIGVGENIHCTRIYKVGGKFVKDSGDGSYVVEYKDGGEVCRLPVPPHFMESADWESGKLKHCAAAIWQGHGGDAPDKGIHYLQALARKQESAGATYLDINVDEYSTDVAERVNLMKWTVEIVQQASSLPVSVDSSNLDILRAGLEACDKERSRPMVNSVSLERADAVAVAAEFNAVVVATAAGENDLPSTTEGRLANIAALLPKLEAAGLQHPDVHLDPLVFPISTDGQNGIGFLSAVRAIRETYGDDIHIVAGLSNISFGMPNRKLINQVFSWLAVEAGADGGIVDPLQVNASILSGLDTASEGFQLAKALLLGEDDFGMNYIMACREGTI